MSEMSPVTRAGVALLDTLATTPPLEGPAINHERDLLLQNRILSSKAHDDRLGRQRAEEELRFAKHRLLDREAALASEHDATSKAAARASQLERKLCESESVAASLRVVIGQLNGKLEEASTSNAALKREYSVLNGTAVTRPDSAAPRKFAEVHKDKMTIIHLSKRLRNERAEFERTRCALENALMEEEDQNSAMSMRGMAFPIARDAAQVHSSASSPVAAAQEGQMLTLKKRSSSGGNLVSFEGIKRYGRGNHALHIPFKEKLDLRTPEESFLDARIPISSFAPQFQTLRAAMSSFAHEWKNQTDSSLGALWYIFGETEKRGAGILANPKQDFTKELKAALFKTKVMIFDMIARMNTGIKDVLSVERKVKQQWINEARPSRDACVSADIPPPPDPRIAQMEKEIQYLKQRQQELQEEHNTKMQELEMLKEKAEVNTQFLQQRVFRLHDSVYNALHSVYKHRFHWAARCPNNFLSIDKNASKKQQLEVQYNVKLVEAIDQDISDLGRFADYFVSDDSFGVDLMSGVREGATKEVGAGNVSNVHDKENAAVWNEGATAATLKRKEAVPTKRKLAAARKLSDAVDSFLLQEKSQMDEDRQGNVKTPSSTPPCTPTEDPVLPMPRREASEGDRFAVHPPQRTQSNGRRSTSCTAVKGEARARAAPQQQQSCAYQPVPTVTIELDAQYRDPAADRLGTGKHCVAAATGKKGNK